MATTEQPPPEGLRDRKKRRTRQAISDIATHLFAEHGFEEVTLAQIAEAAEVSVKTIFNHFGCKEDIYFDRHAELRATLVAAVAERPPGTPPLAGLRTLLAENFVPFPGAPWSALEDPERYEQFRSFMATQDNSPALRARRLVFEEELGALLRGVLASELGRRLECPKLRSLAAMLTAALQLRERTLREAVLAGRPPREVRRRVRTVTTTALDRLEAAFPDLLG